MSYRYFDWNVYSGDAGETQSTAKIVDNIISGCAGKRCAVVLQHDIKGLQRIRRGGRDKMGAGQRVQLQGARPFKPRNAPRHRKLTELYKCFSFCAEGEAFYGCFFALLY